MKQAADLQINARWIIPIEPAGVVLERHAVIIAAGKIRAVTPQDAAARDFAPARTVDLPEHVLIPGLINLHAHCAMNLMRGIADDLPLMRWLQEAIWPTESRHANRHFVRDGSLLAATEMLRGGITTCNDMYFHPEAAAEAFDQAGMRAVIGITVLDFPTPYASDADDYFRKGLAARDAWRHHPRLAFALAPHAPYTVSDASLQRAASLAAELDTILHIHVHETQQEIADALAQHGTRPLQRLASLGLLGNGFVGVHAVHLDDTDIELLSLHGCSVAHCPTSNMKLASGASPIPRLLARGINVGLGTDGAASNNRLDLFQEMRHASLLAKVTQLDATAIPAHTALHMATLGGARALGLDTRIGSIMPGKEADLCAVTLDALETRPCYDPASHLVYAAGREHVTHVWVGGEIRVDKGRPVLQLNDSELLGMARVWQTKLSN